MKKFLSHLAGIIIGFGLTFLLYVGIGGEAFIDGLPEKYKEITVLGFGLLAFVLASQIQRIIYGGAKKAPVEEIPVIEVRVREAYIEPKAAVPHLFLKALFLSCGLILCVLLFYGFVLNLMLSPEVFQGLFIWGGGPHLSKGTFNLIWFVTIAAMIGFPSVMTYRIVKTPYWWNSYFGEGNKALVFLLLLGSGIFNTALLGLIVFLVGGVLATFIGPLLDRSILLVLVMGFICLAIYVIGEVILGSFEKWYDKFLAKGKGL